MRLPRRRGILRRFARRHHPRPRHGHGPGFPILQQANRLYEQGRYEPAGDIFAQDR